MIFCNYWMFFKKKLKFSTLLFTHVSSCASCTSPHFPHIPIRLSSPTRTIDVHPTSFVPHQPLAPVHQRPACHTTLRISNSVFHCTALHPSSIPTYAQSSLSPSLSPRVGNKDPLPSRKHPSASAHFRPTSWWRPPYHHALLVVHQVMPPLWLDLHHRKHPKFSNIFLISLLCRPLKKDIYHHSSRAPRHGWTALRPVWRLTMGSCSKWTRSAHNLNEPLSTLIPQPLSSPQSPPVHIIVLRESGNWSKLSLFFHATITV